MTFALLMAALTTVASIAHLDRLARLAAARRALVPLPVQQGRPSKF